MAEWLLKYQSLLYDTSGVTQGLHSLNPATLMPDHPSQGSLVYSYVETIEQDYSSRPDLKDEHLTNLDAEWFTHGSRFIHEGAKKAGYAKSAEPGVLPSHTSTQEAQSVVLTTALQIRKKGDY